MGVTVIPRAIPGGVNVPAVLTRRTARRTTWNAQAQQGVQIERVAGRGVGVVSFMHSRSRIMIDSRISTMPGRNTSGSHQQEEDMCSLFLSHGLPFFCPWFGDVALGVFSCLLCAAALAWWWRVVGE